MISVIATAYTTTAHAQIDGGALEYMLQRPRVANNGNTRSHSTICSSTAAWERASWERESLSSA